MTVTTRSANETRGSVAPPFTYRPEMLRLAVEMNRIRFNACLVSAGRYSAPDQNLVSFGHRLRQLRLDQRLTQEQLAHDAGLHRTVIGYIERAERDVGVSTLWPLAGALGVTVSELFT